MKKDTIILLLSSFTLLVVVWVIGNIYNASATSTISEDLSAKSMPIDPTFNPDVLTNIRNREQITVSDVLATPSATPTLTPTLTPALTTIPKGIPTIPSKKISTESAKQP